MKWAQVVGACIVMSGVTPPMSPVLAQSNVIPPPNLTAPPPDRPLPGAPVGHRQPRVGELPAQVQNGEDNPQSAMSREDADLDRKIKGICRGC